MIQHGDRFPHPSNLQLCSGTKEPSISESRRSESNLSSPELDKLHQKGASGHTHLCLCSASVICPYRTFHAGLRSNGAMTRRLFAALPPMRRRYALVINNLQEILVSSYLGLQTTLSYPRVSIEKCVIPRARCPTPKEGSMLLSIIAKNGSICTALAPASLATVNNFTSLPP